MSEDATVTAESALVLALARLTTEQRRRAEAYAKALRAHRKRIVVQSVRDGLLPDWPVSAAAEEIESAVHKRRSDLDMHRAQLREDIRRHLVDGLGSLQDMPGHERIRQHLRDDD
jgi:hypothetical protein